MILTGNDEQALREQMYKKIREQLDDIRSGRINAKRIVLVVPAQATLLAEEEGFFYLKEKGFFDFLVMSGARLREEILKETGKPSETVINTIGRNMLLRKITKDKQNELTGYKSICTQDGFIDLCADMMVQLKQHDIDSVKLNSIANSFDQKGFLGTKLNDISVIFDAYESSMQGKFTDSENLLEYTTSKVCESEFIKDSIIWYYDFYSFTEREYEFISKLNDRSIEFDIAILSDKDKYCAGALTAARLSSKLKMKVQCVESKQLDAREYRAIRCSSYYTQSQTMANDILRLIRERGYDYQDIVVLAQDSDMQQNLKRVFQSNGIPVFMDEKRSMQHSFFASFVSNLLLIHENNWKPKDVVGLLKTGILPFGDDEISVFSNYVKQYKIFNKAFLQIFKYGKNDPKYDTAERIRSELSNLLVPFYEALDSAKTVRDKTVALYEFLSDKLHMEKVLESVSADQENLLFLDEAQETKQVWEVFISLMEQLVDLIGDEEMELSEYEEIITSSFKDIKIGVLPESDGKVSIGSITRSSFSNIKALYIAGFNDGLIPKESERETIFTDREIQRLESEGAVLVKNRQQSDIEEMFQIDRALDTACDYMCLCFCASNLSGDSMNPSYLLNKICTEKNINIENDDCFDETQLGFIQSKKTASQKLIQMLKGYIVDGNIPEEWKSVSNLLIDDEQLKPVFDALFFNPYKNTLSSDAASKLFEKQSGFYLSPSQLEMYAACPFKHFIQYGLHPDLQKSFQTDSMEAGTAYHAVLERLSAILSKPCVEAGIEITDAKSPWMNISDEEIKELVYSIIDDFSSTELDGVLQSSGEEKYKTGRIKDVAVAFAQYMIRQVRKGHISSMHFEREFGNKKELPAVIANTSFGPIRIEGKIDRTDILKTENHEYIKVIDYKSGNKSFSKDKVLAGLDLQLMIYLDAASAEREDLEAGGVFYYLVKHPDFNDDFENVISEIITDDLTEKLSKNYSLDGLAVSDIAFLSSLDSEITDSEKPKTDVFKTKSQSGYASLISKEDMEKLRADFRGILSNLSESLYSGNADVNPKVFKNEKSGCLYCDFSSICTHLIG